jgi:hypothetical protein
MFGPEGKSVRELRDGGDLRRELAELDFGVSVGLVSPGECDCECECECEDDDDFGLSCNCNFGAGRGGRKGFFSTRSAESVIPWTCVCERESTADGVGRRR